MYQINKSINTSVKDSWQIELEQLQREQEQDLKNPVLSWWQPKQLTEEEHFEMLAESAGLLS